MLTNVPLAGPIRSLRRYSTKRAIRRSRRDEEAMMLRLHKSEKKVDATLAFGAEIACKKNICTQNVLLCASSTKSRDNEVGA